MRLVKQWIVFIFCACALCVQAQKNTVVLPLPLIKKNKIESVENYFQKDSMLICSHITNGQLSADVTTYSAVDHELQTFEIVAPRVRSYDCPDGLTKPCHFIYSTNEASYSQNSLASVLENETALTLKPYGIGSATLSARGTASSQNTVTWNGINLQNAMSGVVDLSTISMNTVQRASVSYGGSSAANGSGAIGSVIALENSLPIQNGVTGKINFGIGSAGDNRESMQLNYVTPKFATGVSAMYHSADNNFLFRNTAEIGQPLQNLVNAQENTTQVLHQTRTTLNEKQTLNTYIWYTHADRQLPPTMAESNTHQFQRDENLRALADWSKKTDNTQLHIRGGYTDEFLTYSSDVVNNSRNRATTALADLRFTIRDFLSEKNNLKINTSENQDSKSEINMGLSLADTRVRSSNFPDGIHRSRASAFAGYTFQPKNFQMTVQIREELTDGKVTPFIYSLDLKYKILQSYTHNLRLLGALSHNYNVPPLNELYWQNYGNPNLLPEESRNAELGLEYTYRNNAFSFTARSTAFHINMINRIQAVPQSNGQFHPINIPEVRSDGVESFASVHYFKNNFSAMIETSHTYTHAVNNENHLLIYIPENVLNTSLFLRSHDYFFRYTQIFSGRRYMTTDNSYWTNPYTIGNIVIGTEKKIKIYAPRLNFTIHTQFHIKNVFDTDYQVIAYYPMPKRTFLFQIGFGF